jgi:hypothetical protein
MLRTDNPWPCEQSSWLHQVYATSLMIESQRIAPATGVDFAGTSYRARSPKVFHVVPPMVIPRNRAHLAQKQRFSNHLLLNDRWFLSHECVFNADTR